MDCEAAAKLSNSGYAIRDIDVNRFEVFDSASGGFFMAECLNTGAWEVDRKPGRGSRKKGDWSYPVAVSLVYAIDEWKAEQEGRGLIITKPWMAACEASPVGRAFRVKTDRLLMVRDKERRTWVEVLNAQILTPKAGPFAEYDGWEPMPADHYYATIDLTQEYNHRFTDGGRLGFKALNGEPAEPEPKPKKLRRPKPGDFTPVDDSAITAAASIAQSLAAAIASTTGQDRSELVKELTRLSGHLSWHLREDRGKYRAAT